MADLEFDPTEFAAFAKARPTPLATGSEPAGLEPGPLAEPGSGIDRRGLLPAMLEEFKRNPLPFIGATAAGLVSPAATVVGGAAQAMLGAGAGSAAQIIGQTLSGSERAPETSREAAGRIGMDALAFGAAEGAARLPFKALAPFSGAMKSGSRPIMEEFEKQLPPLKPSESVLGWLVGRKRSGVLPPEVNRAATLDLLRRVALSKEGGENMLKAADAERFDLAIRPLIDDVTSTLGPVLSPEELGRVAAETVSGNFGFQKAIAQRLYRSIDDATAGDVETKIVFGGAGSLMPSGGRGVQASMRPVRTGGVTADVEPLKRELKDVLYSVVDEKKTMGSPELDSLLREIHGWNGQKSFSELQGMRSKLRTFREAEDVAGMSGGGTKVANLAVAKLTKTMERSLEDAGKPELVNALRRADAIYSGAHDQFNTYALGRLVRMVDPRTPGAAEKVGKEIFENLEPSQIREVKRALLETGKDFPEVAGAMVSKGYGPATWESMQQLYARHLLDGAKDSNGAVVGKKLQDLLSGDRKRGTLPAILGDNAEAQRKLDLVARLQRFRAEGGPAKAEARVLEFNGDGGVVSVGLGGPKRLLMREAGAAILSRVPFSSQVAAWLLTGRINSKVFADGLQFSPRTKAGAAAAAKLALEVKRLHSAARMQDILRQQEQPGLAPGSAL
jgi:hypothetical protein